MGRSLVMIKVGDDILNSAVQILRASYAALPTEADMTNLISVIIIHIVDADNVVAAV